jgi:mannose-6-phosphate isomerase-like protein (cupin superfamily)
MFNKIIMFGVVICLCAGSVSFGQSLDGKPYDPAVDPNIDMYMANWKESMPQHSHGSLIERDILTAGDPMNPPRKGAVLKYVNGFVYASLSENSSTVPTTLSGEQEVFYILSGNGTITAGNKSSDIHSGVAVLVPADLEFTMKNTGGESLTMYIIKDPVPDGFVPLKSMAVVDENTAPYGTSNGHWSNIRKTLFGKNTGLATLHSVLSIWFDSMTINHPHSHVEGCEEVWTAINGTSIAFIGKQIRRQPPGTAYLIPPDGNTPHSNINTTDKPVHLLYFSVRKDIE